MLNNTPTFIQFVAGDKGYQLNFILTDSNGNVVNLTGASLTLNAQLDSDSAVQVAGSMVVDNASAGTCHYLLTGTDFEVSGVYNAQVVASFSSGSEIMTWDQIQIDTSTRVPQ